MRRVWRPTLAVLVLGLAGAPAEGQEPSFGFLYHDGEVVRTIVPPAATPKRGRDPLFMVTNGVEGQLGIAAVAPGDRGYHGGKWAVYAVTFADDVEPYLLTSAEAVMAAKLAGDVEVVRMPLLDFKCPIQP
jgi:hypothetical protein